MEYLASRPGNDGEHRMTRMVGVRLQRAHSFPSYSIFFAIKSVTTFKAIVHGANSLQCAIEHCVKACKEVHKNLRQKLRQNCQKNQIAGPLSVHLNVNSKFLQIGYRKNEQSRGLFRTSFTQFRHESVCSKNAPKSKYYIKSWHEQCAIAFSTANVQM